MEQKVGIGFDIHRLVEARKLVIGGVEIPFNKGLLAHSDGDVLLHAISDALLGAANLPDIGELFPDNDPHLKGIKSTQILKQVDDLLIKSGYMIINIDAVIIAQAPKMSVYKEAMCEEIAKVLHVDIDDINIKAKTYEGIGELGNSQAIACYAVVLIGKEA